MLSGNGRHRRPRQAPALVVAAGVTGSAIAIPLLGATSASAVEATAWDKVAECETGGLWTADTGNGFYGGLQMSQETWKAFGGTQYASRADLATPAQQKAIAEKVVDSEGIRPWRACATLAGVEVVLDPNEAPTAPTKPAAQPTPSAEPTEIPKPSAPTGTAPAKTPAKTPAPAGSAPSGSGAASPESSPGQPSGSTGKHRGEAATESSPEQSAPTGASESTGSAAPTEPVGDPGAPRETDEAHPSRGEGSRSDLGTTDAGATTAEQSGTASVSPGSYTVQAGDNLWAIAEKNELPGGWPALYEANKETVGDEPDLIHPGQSLDLTAK
ncbi:transglycosylase family protein [Streptomyces sp. NPDC005963]|uniref:transglycosylase family protein n=1 Tax=Streptomyces sp. NPDC005963 TaxID=3156721 RepID=UPI0033EF9600